MPAYTLLVSSVFSLAAALVYGWIGRLLSRRNLQNASSDFAWKLFTTWWYALSATNLVRFATGLLGYLGVTLLPLFAALTYINLLLICVALWGLLYYLIYIFTGKSGVLVPLTLFYVFYYVALVYYVTVSTPVGIEINRWDVNLEYRFPLTGPFIAVVLAMLILPQIIGAIAYLTLVFKVREPEQRYRIVLVSTSVLVWFGHGIFALAGGVAEQDWWQVFTRLIGLAAALTILAAYRPPGFVQRRFGFPSTLEPNE